MGKRSGVALLSVAFALLLAAWVFSTPPFSAPDEAAHYLRALSIANGRLLGPRVPYLAPTLEQTAWVRHDARGVLVPAPLSPPGGVCPDGTPDTGSRRCIEATYTGDYQPLPYMLPALALSMSSRSSTAVWFARLASAAPCLAFVLLAFALLWSGTAWSVLGLLAAVTPMTLFVGSVINPNGLEVAADLAFAAGVVRLSRAPTSAPRWVWAAVACSGAAAVLAWQLGWLFVGTEAALLVALLGWGRWQSLASAHRVEVRLTVGALLSSGALYLVYSLSAGLLHGAFGVRPILTSLSQGLHQLGNALFGAVGVFGALTVGLPAGTYWLWWLLVLALLGGAFMLGQRRDRVVLLFVTVLALMFPVLFYAWVFRHSGFGLQARYVMPLLALIPILAGEIIFRAHDRLPRRVVGLVPSVGVTMVACFQLFAWWVNARDWASEPDAVWFLAHPHWSPPLGWWPWMIAAIAGTAVLLVFAANEARSESTGSAWSRVRSAGLRGAH